MQSDKFSDKAIAAGLGLIGAYFLFTTLRGIFHFYSPIPFSDQWGGYVGFIHKLVDGHYSAWWAQHMEHRIVLARALEWLDANWFGGKNVFLLVAGAILQCLTVCLFVWQAKRHQSPVHPVAVAGIVLSFLFSWIQQENFAWGFQNQFFAVYLFGLSALAFHPPEKPWALALLCGVLATLSMGNGIFVFAVLALQSFLLRQSRRDIAIPIVAGAFMAVIYFYGFHKPDVVFPATTRLQALERIPAFIVLFMGSPVVARGYGIPLAICAGAISLIVMGTLVTRLYLHEQMTRYRAFLISGYALIFASACGAAAGRYKLGVGQAIVSRYDTPLFVSWACLALLLIDVAKTSTLRRATVICTAIVALWLAPYQKHANDDTQMQFERNFDTLSLKLGVDDPELSGRIYPITSRPALRDDEGWAAATDFGPFGYGWLHDVGLVHFSADRVDNSLCTGYTDRIDVKPTNAVADGWVVTARHRTDPVLIVLVDAHGETVGYGVSGSVRYDVRSAIKSELNVGWTGLAPAGVKPVAAYAYELQKFCRLPVAGSPSGNAQ